MAISFGPMIIKPFIILKKTNKRFENFKFTDTLLEKNRVTMNSYIKKMMKNLAYLFTRVKQRNTFLLPAIAQ